MALNLSVHIHSNISGLMSGALDEDLVDLETTIKGLMMKLTH